MYADYSFLGGDTEVVKFRNDNLAQMKNCIPLHILSKSFQDAVEVTRRLSIRYIWIDSLCIIQDSDADWDKEALQMELVYNNCFFNIAATHSANGEGGLFTRRDPLTNLPLRVLATFDNEEPKYLMCINANSWVDAFEKEPLNTRGWVIQERIFSPRICHFTSSQVIWECNDSVAFEKFADGPSSPGHAFTMDGLKTLSTMTEATPTTWQVCLHLFSF